MTKRRPKGDGEKNGRKRQSEAAVGRGDQSTIGFQRFMSCHRAIFSDWALLSDERMWMHAIRADRSPAAIPSSADNALSSDHPSPCGEASQTGKFLCTFQGVGLVELVHFVAFGNVAAGRARPMATARHGLRRRDAPPVQSEFTRTDGACCAKKAGSDVHPPQGWRTSSSPRMASPAERAPHQFFLMEASASSSAGRR